MLTDVYAHTYDVMNTLKTNGVTPEWVQVGNEIPNGILWPEGSTANFGQLAQLLNKGYDAVKAVSAAPKVVIHLDKGNDNARFVNFFDQLTSNGDKYDVIGLSYYPYWLNQDYTASIASLGANLTSLVSRYGKDVLVTEVGGDYTLPQNTYDMLLAVQEKMRAVPNGKGLGVFYWELEGAKSWSGYQLGAWDATGRPSAALNAFLAEPVAVANPGFEATAATQTPSGWTSWSNGNYGADYTEAGGHTGSYRLAHWQNTAYQVSTYQLRTGLATGTYTLRAWVKSSGGQTTCQLYAKNFGGAEKDYPLPVTTAWTQIQISDIQVTNGQCEIGLWSDAKAGNWANLDDVQLYTSPALSARGTGALHCPPPAGRAPFGLYPNPAADVLTLTLPAGVREAQARIYSATGQLMRTATLRADAPTLSIAALKPGFYQVQLVGARLLGINRFIKN